jgi:hypothetical protein
MLFAANIATQSIRLPHNILEIDSKFWAHHIRADFLVGLKCQEYSRVGREWMF